MFDPSIGRWLTPDPIGFEGGDNNLYRFVGNDPTTETDPSGLEDPNKIGWGAVAVDLFLKDPIAKKLLKDFIGAGGRIENGKTPASPTGGAQLSFGKNGKNPIITIDYDKMADADQVASRILFELIRWEMREIQLEMDKAARTGKLGKRQYTKDDYIRDNLVLTYNVIQRHHLIAQKLGRKIDLTYGFEWELQGNGKKSPWATQDKYLESEYSRKNDPNGKVQLYGEAYDFVCGKK